MVVRVFCFVLVSLYLFFSNAFARPGMSVPFVWKDTMFGGAVPVICVPLTAKSETDIVAEARTVKALKPDMVEVRADYWDCIEDTDAAIAVLKKVRKIMTDTPILLTVRIKSERGYKDVADEAKFAFLHKAVAYKLVQLVDMELAYGVQAIREFADSLENTGVLLVVAHHDMTATPTPDAICDIMEQEIAAGGDVAKIVVKPNTEEDVLAFLSGVLAFRRQNPEYPIIASASGDIGRITRLVGGLFGIDLTFAAGVKGSNPTQMPVSVVREAFKTIY